MTGEPIGSGSSTDAGFCGCLVGQTEGQEGRRTPQSASQARLSIREVHSIL